MKIDYADVLAAVRSHPDMKRAAIAESLGISKQLLNYVLRGAGLTRPHLEVSKKGCRMASFTMCLDKETADFFDSFPHRNTLIRKILKSYKRQWQEQHKGENN